jgi:hypothetical protein
VHEPSQSRGLRPLLWTPAGGQLPGSPRPVAPRARQRMEAGDAARPGVRPPTPISWQDGASTVPRRLAAISINDVPASVCSLPIQCKSANCCTNGSRHVVPSPDCQLQAMGRLQQLVPTPPNSRSMEQARRRVRCWRSSNPRPDQDLRRRKPNRIAARLYRRFRNVTPKRANTHSIFGRTWKSVLPQ